MTFTTSLIGSLAWPLLVAWALYLFRKPTRRLIDRIKTLKWKDLQADLDDSTEALDKAAKEQKQKARGSKVRTSPEPTRSQPIEEVREPVDAREPLVKLTETPLVSNPHIEDWEELKDLVLMSSQFVVHLAGEVLDGAVRKAANKPFPSSSVIATLTLKENPSIPESLIEAITQLQRYRNHVEGTSGMVLDSADARTYVDNVKRAIDLLEQNLSR